MRLVLAILTAAFLIGQAAAADPRQAVAAKWWATLTEDQRYGIQENLVLLGYYDGFVDATFGPATFAAIRAFEKSVGDPTDGTLSKAATALLSEKGLRVFTDLGMDLVVLEDKGVGVYAPRTVLSEERRDFEGGLTLSTRDSNFTLSVMGWEYSEQTLSELTAELVTAEGERSIEYQALRNGYAVVSGTFGDMAFYSMVAADGERIVGVEVLWTDEYADIGGITAAYAASYSGAKGSFVTQEATPPAEEADLQKTTDVPREAQVRHDVEAPSSEPPVESLPPSGDAVADISGQQFGPFFVPGNDPTVILLIDEIVPGSTLDFRRALRAQPAATILMLGSPGGSVNEGLLVAHQVADRKLETFIPKGAACYSACAYIFFAGRPRSAEGELGVHQIYGEGVDASDTQVVLSDVLDALYEFGVPQDVVSTMLRTRPNEMYVFTPSELEKLAISRSSTVLLDPPKVIDRGL